MSKVGNDDKTVEDRKFVKLVNKIMPVAMALMCLLGVTYLAAGQLVLPNDSGVSTEDCTPLDTYFEVVRDNGSIENITLPGTYEQYEEEELILTTTLTPEVFGEWLMVWNMGHEMSVYVNDELRLKVDNEGRRLFPGDVAYQFDFVNLKEADAGQTLSIHFPKYQEENRHLGSVYIGDKAALVLKAVRPHQFPLFLGIVMVVIGIVTMIRVRFFRRETTYELFYMCLGVTISSAWFLFNSPAAQFIFPNVETAKDCAFIFAAMIPLPFLMYVGRLFRGRYSLILAILKICSTVSFFYLMIGFLFTDLSLNGLFIPTEISAVAGLGITFALITGDIQNRRIREYYLAAIGITCFIAFALLYVILFILFPFRGDSGSLLMAGIICLYFLSMTSYYKKKDR